MNLFNNKFLNGGIKFYKNKLFYLDQNEDVVFFSELKTLNFTYLENFQNQVVSKLNIFNLPIKLKIKHDIAKKNFNTELPKECIVPEKCNTYKYKGLPPNPISYVGKETLNIIYENYKTDFLFYFFDKSLKKHIFSNDFDGKMQAIDISHKDVFLDREYYLGII